MTIANPDYNPGWEIIHDYHHEHRTRLEKDIRAFHRAMSDDYARLEELKKEFNFHHQTLRNPLIIKSPRKRLRMREARGAWLRNVRPAVAIDFLASWA